MLKRVSMAVVAALLGAAAASAQTPPASQQPTSQAAPVPVSEETRPATTTFRGDTGLWFVPTGEVLPAKRWSFSVYRVNFDYNEGFTDVSNWPVTFGVGLGDRAEIFGAWDVVRRARTPRRPATPRPPRRSSLCPCRCSRRGGVGWGWLRSRSWPCWPCRCY